VKGVIDETRASDTKTNPMISDQATRHDPPQ